MRTSINLSLACMLVATLGACGPAPSDLAPAPEQNAAPDAPAAIAATTSDLISSTPASLPNCDKAIAAIEWNASSQPGVTRVHVMAKSSDKAAEALFSASGPHGKAQTENWVRPGTAFVLRNADNGMELATIVIGGPRCGLARSGT